MLEQTYWEDKNAVKMACSVLKKGGVIVYPTDTLYGFGCDAKNEFAIQKINSIKGRTAPMSVLAPNKETVSNWMNLSENEKKICLDKLGGPVTVIAPVLNNIVSDLITGENQTLGIRIPEHNFCESLATIYPNPITSTSVNRTGEPAMTDPNLIFKEFRNEIDLLVEDGILGNIGSIIYILKENSLKILRS